ncbi:hypothetical protein GQ457_05G023810 [Hibiscus cannabinus]
MVGLIKFNVDGSARGKPSLTGCDGVLRDKGKEEKYLKFKFQAFGVGFKECNYQWKKVEMIFKLGLSPNLDIEYDIVTLIRDLSIVH